MNFIGSKILETDRLVLKPSSMKEQKRLYEILMIPEVNKWYLTSSKKNKDNKEHWLWEKQEKYYQMKVNNALNNDVFCWSIFIKDADVVIGQISCQELNEDKAIRDIGWFIDPVYQRKGYAYEAARKVIDYMFNEVKIKAISSSCVKDNIGSAKLFEKLNFIKIKEEVKSSPYTFYDGELLFSFYELYNVDEEFFNDDNLKYTDIDETVIRVKAIIMNDHNEILLGHSYTTYQFPGGHLEKNESLTYALSRELKEELGIDINLDDKIPFFRVRYYSKNYRNTNLNRHNIIYYFYINTDLNYNMENSNLDSGERLGNYKPVIIDFNLLDEVLEKSIELDPINETIVKEMTLALNKLKEIK